MPGTTYRFGPFRLEPEERRLCRDGQAVPMQGKVFDLLLLLVRRAGRLVTKQELLDTIWPDVVVDENNIAYTVSILRKALTDAPGVSVENVRGRGYRLVADVQEEAVGAPAATGTAHEPCDAEGRPLRQEIRYCTAPDGVRLAWARVGSGPPIVKVANWLNHLELDWESPVWPHWLEMLARDHSLIRYDARGNGLSDWEVADISAEAFLSDLEGVVEAAEANRFVLLGMSQGAGLAVRYATRHPERVAALVLIGGWARGWRAKDHPALTERIEAIITLMQQGWGRQNPAFRQIFTSAFFPDAAKEQMDWFNELQRQTASPDNAARITRACGDIDASAELGRVRAPTLVVHSRGDALVPMKNGVELAAGIEGARFVPLESRNHVLLADEPAWPRFVAEFRAFVAEHGC
ncbi:MAG: alpha/beta fold hydrolase [Myxococcota bacterium]